MLAFIELVLQNPSYSSPNSKERTDREKVSQLLEIHEVNVKKKKKNSTLMMTIKLTKPRFLWHYGHSEPSNFSDVEGCLVHYRMFSSIPGPYPLDPIAGTAVIITTVSKKGTFLPCWWGCKLLQLL